MPASQMHESVVVPDDNAVFASPMSSLTHQMSSAGLTPAAAAAAAAAGSNKPALISDSVKFSIDDSNDSLLQFAGGTATPSAAAALGGVAAGSQQRRRPTLLQQQLSCEDDEDEVDWVLRRPARLRYDDGDDDDDEDSARCNGTPIRSRAAPTPAFCSSPSEPTLRRRLWSPSTTDANARSSADQQQQQQLRLASVPLIGFSSSPTSMQAPPPPPRPPPTSTSSAAVQHQQSRRRSFKRPSPTVQQEQQQQQLEQTPKVATPKRRRMGRTPLGDSTNSRAPPAAEEQQPKKPPLLQRCTSEMSTLVSKCGNVPVLDSVKVDKAIASIDSLNLIGNSEQQHSLPTVTALDFGIRYVTGATVSGLLHGQFADRVSSYKIIDCRYPYEFDGGHIQGAINIYKQEDLLSTIMEPAVAAAQSGGPAQSGPVLIFHCEFSSERAPRLARFLRQKDRESNAENYPLLHFPEVYLLKDGYKAFFNGHKADCQPVHYRRMADPAFRDELAAFQRDRLDWQRRSSHNRHSRLQRLASCQQFH